MRIDPNDPRITAYLLGELEAADRTEIEKMLEECEESRRHVDELRETSTLLFENFSAAPVETLAPEQRATVEEAARKDMPSPDIEKPTTWFPWVFDMRWGMAVSACLVVFVGIYVSRTPSSVERSVKEVALISPRPDLSPVSRESVGEPVDEPVEEVEDLFLAAVPVVPESPAPEPVQVASRIEGLEESQPKSEAPMVGADTEPTLIGVEKGTPEVAPSSLPEAVTAEDAEREESNRLFKLMAPWVYVDSRVASGTPEARFLNTDSRNKSPWLSVGSLLEGAELADIGPEEAVLRLADATQELAFVPENPPPFDPTVPRTPSQIADAQTRYREFYYKKYLAPGDSYGGRRRGRKKVEEEESLGRQMDRTYDLRKEAEVAAGLPLLQQNQPAEITELKREPVALEVGETFALDSIDRRSRVAGSPDTSAPAQQEGAVARVMGGVGGALPAAKPKVIDLDENVVERAEIVWIGATEPSWPKGRLGDDDQVALAAAPRPQRRYLERVEPVESSGEETYQPIQENRFKLALDEPLATFSIDVDTGAYSNMRRFLNHGNLPPADSVRIEEMINYFDYRYAPPTGEHPFATRVAIDACPWNPGHRLARIGIKGKEVESEDRGPCNLVLLVDVSGSMKPANKLPLVVQGMNLLINQLRPDDRVAIVTYAGCTRVALESTPCKEKTKIRTALKSLGSGGSTNGEAGIGLAYEQAEKHFVEEGVNRVILATDGDFNVGVSDRNQLVTMIEKKAKTGVFLSVLGFGMGNLQDYTLENLADKGNGNYAYIDTLAEAQKVLVDQLTGTLVTIAKDVKIQIEFNPGKVGAYRLIGYENRALANRDFNDDTKDAGEIGAGHTVTALYELIPAGSAILEPGVDALKYQKQPTLPKPQVVDSDETLTVKLRYKAPDGDRSSLIEMPVRDDPETALTGADAEDFKFAAAVASYGMLLRDSRNKGTATFDTVLDLARSGKGDDPDGYRAEFIGLVGLAKALKGD